MNIKARLQRLEDGHSSPAERWLTELLAELTSARTAARTPTPRRATGKEQADLLEQLPAWGLDLKIIDNEDCQW